MKGFLKYGSIENIRKSNEVLLYSVVVTEKLHGTNARVVWANCGLVLGSRNNIIYKDGKSTDQDGYNFGDFMETHPCLEFFHNSGEYDDYVFYGEFHGSNIQKGVKYCDEKDFRVFDIRDPEGNFLDWEDVEKICKKVGFKIVPVLFKGKIDVDGLNKLLNVNSQCAIENGIKLEENIAEGLVIKPLKNKIDRRGNRIIVKYKSEKWAENTRGAKAPKQLSPEEAVLHDKARDFANMVVTQGRVATVVEHITRDGNTNLGMSRTGDFLQEFVKDVIEEYKEFHKSLSKNEWKVYSKTMCSQASNLWKQYLMEK